MSNNDLDNVDDEIVSFKPSEDLLESLAEASEIINNPLKYPRYNNLDDLKKSLLSDD